MDWYQFIMLAIGFYAFHRENVSIQRETHKEMKDFHGRLCTLEERYIQMMERFMKERK